MRSRISAVAVLLMLAGHAVAVGGWNEFWARFQLDQRRMNCWPEPFTHADRDLARTPFIAMIENGWRVENTISDHMFEVTNQALTQAGRLKVRWIVTQAPPQRRTVFVLRGTTPDETMQRVESVQQYISSLTLEGQRPEVLLTDVIPAGGSGDYFDAVDKARMQTIPAPRLPAQATESGN